MEEVRSETQAGQERGHRSQCRGRGEVLFTGLLIMTCLACILIGPRTTNPGMAPPTMGGVLPHQSLIKQMPYRLAYSQLLNGGIFSIALACVKLTLNYPALWVGMDALSSERSIKLLRSSRDLMYNFSNIPYLSLPVSNHPQVTPLGRHFLGYSRTWCPGSGMN